jgi:hypothetical protein
VLAATLAEAMAIILYLALSLQLVAAAVVMAM